MNFRVDYEEKTAKPVRTQAKKINIMGKFVAITGALPGMNRWQAENWVTREKKAAYASKVDSRVSYLIVGKSSRGVKESSKIVAARKFNVKMIEFHEVA